jgi:chaperonin GroES
MGAYARKEGTDVTETKDLGKEVMDAFARGVAQGARERDEEEAKEAATRNESKDNRRFFKMADLETHNEVAQDFVISEASSLPRDPRQSPFHVPDNMAPLSLGQMVGLGKRVLDRIEGEERIPVPEPGGPTLIMRSPGEPVRLGEYDFQVYYDKLLVQRMEPTRQTAAGIELPQASIQDRTEGVVLATGEGRLMPNGQIVSLKVRPGDLVLFHAAQGIDMSDVQDRLILLREDEVLASRRIACDPEGIEGETQSPDARFV